MRGSCGDELGDVAAAGLRSLQAWNGEEGKRSSAGSEGESAVLAAGRGSPPR